jgi:hypothetical protein
LLVPLTTFHWTLPKPLGDIYLWSTATVLSAGTLAIILVFAKRLHDQGINGLWALLVLIAFPLATLAALNQVPHGETLSNVAGLVWCAAVLVLALRTPSPVAERYGPRIEATAVLKPRHPVVVFVLSVVAVLVSLSLYAGFLQGGIWVGRKGYSSYSGPSIDPPGGGKVLAQCGNVKGISAQVQKGEVNGFTRDAVRGDWTLVVLPDGTLDIQTYSDRQVLSYLRDGFIITANGLRFNDDGYLAKDVDRFMVVARAINYTGTVETITVMSFARSDYNYLALISSTRSLSKETILSERGPRASGFLMMADCNVSQY